MSKHPFKYCESVSQTIRLATREVMVGDVGIGGGNPIRIQSMTTSSTHDVEATIQQVIRLADAGCDIVRVTVQGMKEALACEGIKNGLLKRGYTIPLVADIHFYPKAAMTVVEFVDKVRINPGNFVDRRATFREIEYDDASYQLEIEKIEEKFIPLIEKCKTYKKVLRIGTNHGSLSDRIMNRYGDTADGMVESALEFMRVARAQEFHDVVFSMKASNTHVMIEAYRKLAASMIQLGWDYPLHLGVTEAGEGEDGRVKSAVGMGSLLMDGLGDTIRVSLTEDPWCEVDPCKRLVTLAEKYQNATGHKAFNEEFRSTSGYKKRSVHQSDTPFLHRSGTVIVPLSSQELDNPYLLEQLGCDDQGEGLAKGVGTVDAILLEKVPATQQALDNLRQLKSIGVGVLSSFVYPGSLQVTPLESEPLSSKEITGGLPQVPESRGMIVSGGGPEQWARILEEKPTLILLSPTSSRLHFCREFFEWLQKSKLEIPVILSFNYEGGDEDILIPAAAEMGALFCDGLPDGVLLRTDAGVVFSRKLGFNILQGARLRTTKAEFISCPGCGRTLFDLQEVAGRIRERTGHLVGIKIAIMGCIVNGPGEMADADFGYVGSQTGKVDLYVQKECVERNIDFAEADDRLIALIKAHDRWVEPQGQVLSI